MRNLLRYLALLLLCTIPLAAQKTPSYRPITYLGGYYNFAPISSQVASEYIDLRNGILQSHTIDFSLTSGTLSVCTFNVEASSDAVNWYDISGTQTCTASAMFHIAYKPVRYLRINVLSYTGNGVLQFNYTGAN